MYDKQLILQRASWLRDVMIFKETKSTQQEAKIKGKEALYLAEKQIAAYGRFGREYFSTDDGGIYMSLLLKPQFAFEQLPQYTLLTAASIVMAIEKLTNKKPMIKWVNDIYLNDKKVVGILTEAITKENAIQHIIVGVGINFNIKKFPSMLVDYATSLFTENEEPTITASELIGEIWKQFNDLLHKDFLKIYKAHSFILGKTVHFRQNGIDYEGIASELTDQGELVVELEGGLQKILNSGEISIKKWT